VTEQVSIYSTSTEMTSEFTAPLNQTGGVGNASSTGGNSTDGSGTVGEFTGAAREGKSVAVGMAIAGVLFGVAAMFTLV